MPQLASSRSKEARKPRRGKHLRRRRGQGAVEINGVRIDDARDGAAIKDVAVVRMTAVEDAEVVMVDTP